MALSTSQLRVLWSPACRAKGDVYLAAYAALDACMRAHNYRPRAADTGAYNCRTITGGSGYSLHAYGPASRFRFWSGVEIATSLAVDINWQTNPYGPRLVTDMPRAMIDAIYRVRTRNGKQVFRWGGYYTVNKDAMHFEIVVSPADLATGIDPSSLPGAPPTPIPPEDPDMPQNILIEGDKQLGVWWTTDGIVKSRVEDNQIAAELAYIGLLRWQDGKPFRLRQGLIDAIELSTVADQIVWYVGNDGKGSHAYRVWGNVGKHLPSDSDVNLLRALKVREANASTTPLNATWKANVILIDGPARTVPNDVNVAAIASAIDSAVGEEAIVEAISALPEQIAAAIGSGGGGGATPAEVADSVRTVLAESGLLGLLPGQ